jgi:hypothetical protein
MKTINTKWQLWTYDVWGNRRDGYEVNDRYNRGTIELRLRVHTHNCGTDHAFDSASITDRQLQRVFGTRAVLDTDSGSDDLCYYVNRSSDGYPVGELQCVSHESLSPIRALAPVND